MRHVTLVDQLWLDSDVAVIIHLSLTFVDHFAQNNGGSLSILSLLLSLVVLLLELFKLGELGFNRLLPEQLLLFLVLDLLSGSSSLDSCLEHIGSVAFGCYEIQKISH